MAGLCGPPADAPAFPQSAPVITHTTSWPALCRLSRSGERGASIHRDHRDKPGDDGGGCEGRTYPPIHAVSLTALILRGRAAASRRGLRRAPEARCPARGFAPQARPICGFLRHDGQACPGHPDRTSAAFPFIGITGTDPRTKPEEVTTREVTKGVGFPSLATLGPRMTFPHPSGLRTHRSGGAYRMPPMLQSWLRPRGMPRRDLTPTFRS
jgi:hypothetical protein